MSCEPLWLMQVAGDLAIRAAGLIRRRFASCQAWLKDDQTWVSQADTDAQRLILDGIAARFPDHAVLAEEALPDDFQNDDPSEARFCWVIDPLDGTHNFVRGAPIFACSIAVLDCGAPVAAAVVDVMTGLVYRAAAGHGAFVDGRPMTVSTRPAGPRVVVAIPSGREQPTHGNLLAALSRFTLRNIGSSALHLSLVASGGVDAAFGLQVRLWDWAAGMLLVRQAGGRVVDLQGRDWRQFDLTTAAIADMPYIAGPPALVSQIQAIIASA